MGWRWTRVWDADEVRLGEGLEGIVVELNEELVA